MNVGHSSRQYLLIDKRRRRYSAPEDLSRFRQSNLFLPSATSESEDDTKSRISIIDLSILFESNSDSSMELDTSNVSRDTSSPLPLTTSCVSSGPQHEPYNVNDNLLNTICIWSAWKTVMFAQLMAINVSVMHILVENRQNSNFPATGENTPLYFFLSLTWTTQLACRESSRGLIQVLRLSGIRYFFLAVLHVLASNFLFMATDHISFLGNHIIDCVAATLSLIVAYVCLDIQFNINHIIGFGIAFIGGIGLCTMDSTEYEDENIVDVVWGDILNICCGLFLALNSIAQELIVKSIDTIEYLGMVGLIGSFICSSHIIAFKGNWIMENVEWYRIFGYSMFQLLFCCLVPKLLRNIGAPGFHISLISSGFYYYLYQLFTTDDYQISMFVSYVLIIGGLYMFALTRTAITQHNFFPVQVIIPYVK